MTNVKRQSNEAMRAAFAVGRVEDTSEFTEVTGEQAVMLAQSGVELYMLLNEYEKAFRVVPVLIKRGSYTWQSLREGRPINRRLFVRRRP